MTSDHARTDSSIRLELKAISLLCEFWAGSGFESKDRIDHDLKLLHFRDGVKASQGSGVFEDVPFEFLADDYTRVYQAVNYLDNCWKEQSPSKDVKAWLKSVAVPYELGGKANTPIVNLPVPCPPGAIQLLTERLTMNTTNTPSKLAAKIVGKRLSRGETAIDFETVRKALRLRKKERAKKVRANLPNLPTEKKLLISVFFDVSSMRDCKRAEEWRAKILDAVMTDYPVIGVYYLIKVSNELAGRTYLCDYDFSEIEKLYKHAYPKNTEGPFAKLLQA